MSEDLIRILAALALVHETADEAWKSAVQRGLEASPSDMADSTDAFIEGLSAMVAHEKERLRAQLASGPAVAPREDDTASREKLAFELAEIRARLESMETAIDALARRLEPKG